MPRSISVDNAYADYRKALQDLYAPQSKPSKLKTRGAGRLSSAEIRQRSQFMLHQSRNFGNALATALGTNDLDQCELVGWKLLAAAASDISTASDLLEAQEVDPRAEPKRKARLTFEAVPELKEVLGAPSEAEVVGLAKATRKVLPMPKDPEAAKRQLKKTIAIFLDEIPDAAASMSKTAVGEVITSGLAKQIVSDVAQEVLEHLPDTASFLVRHAASMLAEAVRKVEAALGEGVTERMKEEVTSWLKDIMGKRDTVTNLLNKLYETERIGEDTGACVASAPKNTPANRYNQATKTL